MSWKVYLIEDNDTDVILISCILKKYLKDADIIVIKKIADFQRLIKYNTPPDLIICDYNLYDSTGFDYWTLAQEFIDGTPFVFCSGEVNPKIYQDSILQEAFAFLPKEGIEKMQVNLGKIISDIILARIQSQNKSKKF